MQRYIFLHQVKTGGKTVEKFLLRKFESDFIKTTNIFKEESFGNVFDILKTQDGDKINCLNQARVLSGHFPFGLHRLLKGPSRYFTLLRDPVERIRSYYAYSLDNPGSPIHKFLIENDISFDEFVQLDRDQIDKSGIHELTYVLENGQSKIIFGDEENFETKTKAEIITAIDRIIDEHFDFIGVTELFDESFMEISKNLGFSPFNFYLTFNRSNIKVEVSDFAKEVIYERNEIDLHYHGKYTDKTLEIRDGLYNKLALKYMSIGTKLANKYMEYSLKK